ncbi:3-methyl-2-oxobutanoate hydroxymethyltransferase [Mesorhizobium sp. M1E.F.Ca.ET.045.02.1.1]|uniref:3-methyl-2-oxobutanoate hydroxymethyltransferase n=1 Tax=unclassified Mesorhizobium TaxID=325217 RepID=UPI000F7608D6|nr:MULTISPECIES: 3-methyl-2-oxobutanoate hydroxymethyltransferase [unclassified Mesorhizobium]AZO20592.1 3-methyl-2-oxobutanoate hydroxymethyltransferase [Mesorhizobium sp. M1E.F.Ca.ET.045.02.1.1]RUW85840.1 3-methyl-2-oxobutanoate hydroxymethyltransferase [Mesorhizobium sp. M1E.F.Ca.ET.063.01.1.1]
MARSRPTVADLQSMKGKRQLSKLRVFSLEEAEAAERAGIDLISVPYDVMLDPRFRDAAPTCFAIPGDERIKLGATTNEILRMAVKLRAASADAMYCSASLQTIRRLRDEYIPVCGHVGLIPAHATWTGGFKAVGKTAESAAFVWKQVKDLEAAGAFAAEIEVVPAGVASAISRRTPLIMISMGAGAGCDAQYLFSEDVLGSNRGRYPRHAKRYRDFAAEFDRLQNERIAAFREYAEDIQSGAYPEPRHTVEADPEELRKFEAFLASEGN